MQIKNTERLDGSKIKLTILVEKDEFEAAIEKAYRKDVKKINIQGFRRGKAPRKIIEKMYGPAVFYEDAVNLSYPEMYEKALNETGFKPVDRADVDVASLDENGYTFTAEFTVAPEMKLGQYKGLTAERPSEDVTDAEIDEEIERMRQRNSRLVAVDREIKNGDTAVFDYKGTVDGVAFEGGSAENHTMVIGSNQFIPGFEDQMIGMKAGEEKDVNVTFPTEYHASELAGKAAVFAVKVHEVKERELPELDDEFARDVSDKDTIAELRDDIKNNLIAQKKANADNVFESNLLDKIIDNSPVEIPQCMVDHQVGHIMQDFAQRVSMQGIDMDNYFKLTGETEEGMRERFAPQALRQVKIGLIFDEIAKLEKIEVTDEDLEAEYKKLAEQYNMEVEKIKGFLNADMMKDDMSGQKAAEFLRNNNTAVAEAPKAEEKKPAKKPAAKKTTKKAAEKTEEAPKAEEKKPAKKPAAKKTAKKSEEEAK